MSRILKTAILSLAGAAISTAASAGCSDGMYCNSGSANLAPLGSWSSSSGSSYTMGSSYNTASTRYVSTPSYTSSYGGVASESYANATYGSGSISSTYTDGDVQMYGFSGSTSSLPGLGMNESLQSTSCPTSVYNPEGGRVLGCYNVVKPVAQTRYYRIVRPVIYVRYPVPVAVPYYSGCNVVTHVSRYGGFGHHGYHGRRCG